MMISSRHFYALFFLALSLLYCLSERGFAKDLGVMGKTYPIIEMDFLDLIKNRFNEMKKNGEWSSVEIRTKKNAEQYRDRPPSVKGLKKSRENKVRKFDPSIILDRNLETTDGKVVAIKGTKINPLNFISLTKTLIFFDGDDEAQVKWIIQQNKILQKNTKLILVNGSTLKVQKRIKQKIYFDQSGALASRFEITHVPTVIIQENKHLLIKEVLV